LDTPYLEFLEAKSMSKPASNSSLNWKVFVPPAIATVSDDLPPGETARMWSPTSSILIYGKRDAILVDTPATTARASALADWVEKSGKNLTTIYTTHGHGDHFFGNGILLECFRGGKAIAAPKVIEMMRTQTSPQVMTGLWNKRFPGLIPENIVFAEQLEGDSLYLGGTNWLSSMSVTQILTTRPASMFPRLAWWWLAIWPTTTESESRSLRHFRINYRGESR
jgi:glyoxylase-like metal-dependent hydrolase (beta-lactamase superfamily II)